MVRPDVVDAVQPANTNVVSAKPVLEAGCKRRFICLKNSSLVDDPVLLSGTVKRSRDSEQETISPKAKGMKLSESNGKEDISACEEPDVGQVQHRILQFEMVSGQEA